MRVVFLSMFVTTAAFAEKPNVLLVCVDDLKPLIACYGDKFAKTPNLDRLAARGVRFEKAYCNQAVCSPSRNSLLTGRRPQSLGIYDLATNFRTAVPDLVTWPQDFKNQGYTTEALGKIFHVGHGNHEDPASWSVPHMQAKSIQYALKENQGPTKEGALFENKDPKNLPRGAAYESADVADDKYADGVIAAEAVKRIGAAKGPFFIAVGFLRPHLPFNAPKKYWDLYDRESLPQPVVKAPPVGAPKFAPTAFGELRQYKDMPANGPINESDQKALIHGYYASISYMDAQLGKVLDALDASPNAKNTFIVLWGDHGWHLGDHGMWCKHTCYEQAARIPVIVAGPGVAAGGVCKEMIETVDIAPTITALCGLPARKDYEGVSFEKQLKDPAAKGKESIIHVFPRGANGLGRAIRTDRYRMVEWKKPNGLAEYELYDYQIDPDERKNIANEQTKVLEEMKAILAKHPDAKPQIKK